MCFDLQVTCQVDNPREVWAFGAANWSLLKRLCQTEDWNRLDIVSPSVGASSLGFMTVRLLPGPDPAPQKGARWI